jgi:hypothetical protein
MNMKNSRMYLGLLPFFSLLFIVGCQPEPSSGGGDAQLPSQEAASQQDGPGLNLVALADLDQTTRVSVMRQEEGDDCTSACLEELFTITDVETVHTLVEALDGNFLLRPRARCPASYTLVFHLADGRQVEFGYACEMASPSFLRGGQGFWLGQDVIAPDIFNRLIASNLNEVNDLEIPFQE